APEDLYARLVEELRARDVEVILDADGEPMLAGIRAGASLVTPNELEAEELVGQEFSGRDDVVHGLTELLRLGAAEAPITPPERAYLEARTRPLDPVSTVGSGDAYLAGYVAARYDGMEPRDCLAYAVACGAESTQHFGAGVVDRNQVERLLDQVELQDLEVHA